jgi:excisionase family DNA binding protein
MSDLIGKVDLFDTVCLPCEPLLVTVAEAGRLLRCGKSKIFEMIKEGVLERRKLGGATRITMASIRHVAGV